MRSDGRDVKPNTTTIPIAIDQIEGSARRTPPPAPRPIRRAGKPPTIPIGADQIIESRVKPRPPAPPPKKPR